MNFTLSASRFTSKQAGGNSTQAKAFLAGMKKGLVFLQALLGDGALERIRTSDRSVRSRVLYPAELRARCGCQYRDISKVVKLFFQ